MNILIPLIFGNFREIVRQPFYYIILLSGCFVILLSFAFAFFAFGEEARMIRDMAISTITLAGLLTGCLSSSILVASEFERQTVLATLCKPVSRAQFILGKYLGILAATSLLIFSQGFVLEVALMIRNYRTAQGGSTNLSSMIDFICILGTCFSFLQILILTAISLILSLYINTIANLTLCIFFFIFCNTIGYVLPICNSDHIITSAAAAGCYMIFPNIQALSMTVINEAFTNSSSYWNRGTLAQCFVCSVLHSTIYCTIVIWLGIAIFKRKEIT